MWWPDQALSHCLYIYWVFNVPLFITNLQNLKAHFKCKLSKLLMKKSYFFLWCTMLAVRQIENKSRVSGNNIILLIMWFPLPLLLYVVFSCIHIRGCCCTIKQICVTHDAMVCFYSNRNWFHRLRNFTRRINDAIKQQITFEQIKNRIAPMFRVVAHTEALTEDWPSVTA